MENNVFITKLKGLQKLYNVSRRALAKEIGISSTILDYYYKGKRNPSEKTIKKIADYFNVPVEYFKDDIEFDPVFMFSYIENSFDSYIDDAYEKLLRNKLIRKQILESLSEHQAVMPLIDNPVRRLLFLYLAMRYENSLAEQHDRIKKEGEYPHFLTDYDYIDIIRLFKILGKISKYGLKATLQEGERILETEKKILDSENLSLNVQSEIVNIIEKATKSSLGFGMTKSGWKQEVRLNFAFLDIYQLLLTNGVVIDEKYKRGIDKLLSKILQSDFENGFIKEFPYDAEAYE